MTIDVVLLVLGGVFGTFIGSFLNVCVQRLPRNQSIVHPPSRCGSCGTRLPWYDNLPVIGYLVLRGRCRWCGTGFSPRYLIMEVFFGAVTAAVVWWAFAWFPQHATDVQKLTHWLWMAGATATDLPGQLTVSDTWMFLVLPGAMAFATLVAIYYALVAGLIDYEHRLIPDELTKPMQVAAPLLSVLSPVAMSIGWSPFTWFVRTDAGLMARSRALDGLAPALGWILVGMVAIAGSIFLLRYVYKTFPPPTEAGGPAKATVQELLAADERALWIGQWWYLGSLVPALVLLLVVAVYAGGGNGSLSGAILAAQLTQACLGSLLGWALPLAIGLAGSFAFRRWAMGYGDMKFLAPIGAFVGPVGIIYVFFLAALIGSVLGIPQLLDKRRGEAMPFGPSLALAGGIVIVAGPWLHATLWGAIAA